MMKVLFIALCALAVASATSVDMGSMPAEDFIESLAANVESSILPEEPEVAFPAQAAQKPRSKLEHLHAKIQAEDVNQLDMTSFVEAMTEIQKGGDFRKNKNAVLDLLATLSKKVVESSISDAKDMNVTKASFAAARKQRLLGQDNDEDEIEATKAATEERRAKRKLESVAAEQLFNITADEYDEKRANRELQSSIEGEELEAQVENFKRKNTHWQYVLNVLKSIGDILKTLDVPCNIAPSSDDGTAEVVESLLGQELNDLAVDKGVPESQS